MAFGTPTTFLNANDKTSSTSWSPTTATGGNAGDYAWISLTTDNATTSTSSNEHSSVSIGSNTFTKVWEQTTSGGGVGNGVTVSLWKCKLSANFSSGATVSIGFANAITCKGAVGGTGTMGSGTLEYERQGGGSTPTSASIGTGTAGIEYLFVAACGFEDNENCLDAASTGCDGVLTDSAAFTTGGGATANISCGSMWNIYTASGSAEGNCTSTTTASGDSQAVRANFFEGSSGTQLTVNAASSASTTNGSLTLSPKTPLTVAAAASAGLADNVVLTAHGTPLTVAGGVSSTLAGAVTLSPKTALTVAAAVSSSLADNVSLGGVGVALVLQNSISVTVARGSDAGAPLVSDSGFDSPGSWSSAASGGTWTVSGSKANGTNAQGNLNMASPPTIAPGRYRIQADVVVTGGLVNLKVGDGVTFTNTTGPVDVTVEVTVGTGSIRLDGGNFTGTVDNFQITPADAVNLTQHGPVLVPASAVSLSQSDNAVLAPKTPLTVANGASLGTASNVVLTPRWAVTVADGASLTQAGAVTLAPKTTLAPAAAVSLTQADNAAVVGHGVLTVANSVSASQATNVTVSVGGTGLVPAGAVSGSLADNVLLSPKTLLAVAAATSLTQASGVTVTPRYALVPADTTSLSQAGGVTLSPKTTLTLQAAASATTADNVVLLPKTTLAVAAAQSLTTAAGLTLASRYQLLVDSALTSTLTDSPTLLPATALALAAATSLSTALAVVLASRYALTVNPVVSLAQSDHVLMSIISTPTPPSRQLAVGGGGDREVAITAEPANDRSASPTGGGDRSVSLS